MTAMLLFSVNDDDYFDDEYEFDKCDVENGQIMMMMTLAMMMMMMIIELRNAVIAASSYYSAALTLFTNHPSISHAAR